MVDRPRRRVVRFCLKAGARLRDRDIEAVRSPTARRPARRVRRRCVVAIPAMVRISTGTTMASGASHTAGADAYQQNTRETPAARGGRSVHAQSLSLDQYSSISLTRAWMTWLLGPDRARMRMRNVCTGVMRWVRCSEVLPRMLTAFAHSVPVQYSTS